MDVDGFRLGGGAGPFGVSLSTTTVNGGQAAELLMPANYNGTLVIYYHGVGGDQDSYRSEAVLQPLMGRILQAGYAVASCNNHGNNWGNQDSIDDTVALYAWARQQLGTVSNVIHFSQSMGGMAGLNTIASGLVPVAGWLGIYPVCSLAAMFDSNSGTYAAQIRTAYGIAGDGSDYATQTDGYDPLELAASTWNGIPMRMFASASDTVVDKAENADAFATKVDGFATENTVVACTGNHGDASHFQPDDVLVFFKRCSA